MSEIFDDMKAERDAREKLKIELSSSYGVDGSTPDGVGVSTPDGKELGSLDIYVPPKLRTAAYWAIGVDAVLAPLVIAVGIVYLDVEAATRLAQVVTALSVAVGGFAALCGIAYRPTRKGV